MIPVMIVAGMAAGCSSSHSTSPQTQVASKTMSPVTAATTAPHTPRAEATVVPKEISHLPDGVYRTELTTDELIKEGVYDPTNAGIWTMTVKVGTYQLDCQAISDPNFDCGASHPSGPTTVEFGSVRGGSSLTVWFVHDMVQLSRINGCVRHSTGVRGCGLEGGYHMDWKEVPGGIAFSNFVGLGDESGFPPLNNFTVKPWTQVS